MITFIYYEKSELLNEQVKLLSEESDLFEYQLDNNNILQLSNEINSIDIFGTKRTFLIHGANFFQIKSHKFRKKELAIFISALQNSKDHIIIALNKSLNFKNVFVNAFNERNYIDLSDEKKVTEHYLETFIINNNIQINYSELQLLKHNLDNNFLLLKNELMKLSNYNNFQLITKEMINDFGVKTIEANAFDLLGYILNNQIEQARKLYNNLISDGNNPVAILALLSTQVRFSYQVKLLNGDNSSKEISSILKVNPYRVSITLKNLSKVSIHQINNTYMNCARIDYLIKSGRLNQELIFDYLIY